MLKKDSPGVAPEGYFTVQTYKILLLTVADLLISIHILP